MTVSYKSSLEAIPENYQAIVVEVIHQFTSQGIEQVPDSHVYSDTLRGWFIDFCIDTLGIEQVRAITPLKLWECCCLHLYETQGFCFTRSWHVAFVGIQLPNYRKKHIHIRGKLGWRVLA